MTATTGSGPTQSPRSPWQAMARGLVLRCPACGHGRLFFGYLRTRKSCAACGQALDLHCADDAPPYFTMLLVGHVVVALVLASEVAFAPPLWLHLLVWPQVTLGLSLLILPAIKGGIIGLQWAFRMHGFGHAPAQAQDPAARE